MPSSLRLLPSSVCGSVSADKTQPGGGTDVALTSIWASYSCSASHGRCFTLDTLHSRPPHSEGSLPQKESSPRQDPRAVTQHRNEPQCCFHSCCAWVCVSVRYQSVIRRHLWVHWRCFLFVSTLFWIDDSLLHTHPFEKQTQLTEMHQYDASKWGNVPRRK